MLRIPGINSSCWRYDRSTAWVEISSRELSIQPTKVAGRPAIPKPSAASASPAMSPPPTSEVVLMSSGSAGALFLSLGKLLTKLANTPPAANHADVSRLTKPPNDDAYGDGSTTASSRKSVLKPTLPALTNFW